MKKLGLALSGGGFRATLYHLGLIRFLRDAGLLSQVTHITSVSGGSIMAAHLVLHWKRYTGSEAEFDEAAAELVNFIQLDVRNRILRRFPFSMALGRLRRLIGKSSREMTRAGLLERHYRKFLYGDVSLFELPKTPKLHVLATNISEGSLCSFQRDGLLMARRQPHGRFQLDTLNTGLATLSMAVAASSAFPGFFPPLELTGADVGMTDGDFGKQAYTDGGVYDNLGVRMFRFLEQNILMEEPLTRGDFLDIRAAFEALRAASVSTEDTVLRRLMEILAEAERSSEDTPLHGLAVVLEEALRHPQQFESELAADAEGGTDLGDRRAPNNVDQILARLAGALCHYQFQHEPLFAHLIPADPAVAKLLKASQAGLHHIDAGEQLWLNRHLLDAAFHEATGKACFTRLNSGLDCVLVSDVGRQMQVVKGQGGGLIRSALRASDILMNRVWQLENETFKGSSEFVFARVTDRVEPEEDPTALHPELQRHLGSIRTDLDRFSPLEISSLIRHGYCVGRKVCRSRPEVFGQDLPEGPPWEPSSVAAKSAPVPSPPRGQTAVTAEARALQAAAIRRVWSRFFDRRDWVSFLYIPVIVPLLFCLPSISYHYYKRFVRLNNLTLSYAQGSPDLAQLDRMLDGEPMKPWKGVPSEEGHAAAAPDLTGFKVLSDSRITDLRAWNPAAVGTVNPDSRVYVYRRVSVVKLPELKGPAFFPIRLILAGAEGEVRFPTQPNPAKVVKTLLADGKRYRWDAVFDLTKAPAGVPIDLITEIQSPGIFLRGNESSTGMSFSIEAETAELSQWVLMPVKRKHGSFRYIRYQKDQPETAEEKRFVTQYLAKDHSILAFKLLSLDPGYEHEISWNYE
ncbi:patatin-like phospholipase family protein [Haloferula sp. BvORR071]|uniref:patatin-like phospholipase family protein n=1 Tax=Haloferula sp. BvORR071 TaxID=1396141 RepID=UPI000550AC1F|nr:patatin-like phospholipase family protein [Haloferula sp. BvORR071]